MNWDVMKGRCCGLNVCVPPKLHAEILTPTAVVLVGEAFDVIRS